MAVNIVITDAGRAEIINAENTGTAPVEITEIGVGTGQYTATPSQTALQNETKRLTTFSGDGIGDDIIHLSIRDESSDAYLVYEFGLYTESGTLFAVYSQSSGPIINKTASSILLLAVDIALKTIDPDSLTFGDTDFLNPPATTQTQGVIQLAEQSEVNDGSSSNKAVTPETLHARTANTTRTGLIARATQAESEAGSNNSKAMTPLTTKQQIDSRQATQAEAEARTNNTKLLTPLRGDQLVKSMRATQGQAEAGTSNDVLMTSLRTKQAIDLFKSTLGTAADRDTGTASNQVPLNSDLGTAAMRNAIGAGDVYARGGILGTVSQSGGAPTGAIFQRGSNSNGEFVRMADGTLIMTRVIPIGEFDWTLNGVPQDFPFPAVTTGFTFVPCSVSFSSSGDSSQWNRYDSITLMSGTSNWRVVVRGSFSASVQSIALKAIARWF
jgi:hypothetical protein